MTKTELVAAVRRHAEAHYEEDGWDYIVEAHEDKDIADIIGTGHDRGRCHQERTCRCQIPARDGRQRSCRDLLRRTTMKARSEDTPAYGLPNQDMLRAADDKTIDLALKILRNRLGTPGKAMDTPATVRNFFTLHLAEIEHEVFGCLWLDGQNRVLAYEELFRGTLTQTSVYPREVVKAALKHNAGAVIFAHNHPSGFAEPSRADELLTSELKRALALIDVRVLDHIVVGGTSTVSFAERGLI